MQRQVTSADVARHAGVSRSAVSLVLNGRAGGNISEENQRRVRAAAAELGYRPNASAVSLRRQRTATVGLVADEIATSPFGGRLVQGARDAALERGYLLFLMDTGSDLEREDEAVRLLRARQVDAFVYAAMSMRPTTVPGAMAELPTVLANCFDERGAGIVPDEVGGQHAATRAVLDAGHRDVTYLAGSEPPGRPPVPAVARRVEGFERALAEVLGDGAGSTRVAGESRVQRVGWDIDTGYHVASRLLERPDRPTAILCANDRLALGVALAATRLGLRVPQDLTLVGYDDEERIASRAVPPLTTVALPHARIGAVAAEMVLDAVATGDETPLRERVLVPCDLVERESVAPPPC
ncbi:LacI family DNA-binding transcriptional regulator [Isoptericola sp. BMS4]|uniref:LacI family DNA-binding transcriptional regulator n=1 Tax=Isoptericola sp. BMS4 TaxID=2527875 RepID=UPI001420D664|nr:LacI family DNA-binding transcriptional regulator [Isoptericola sp. BMS4]